MAIKHGLSQRSDGLLHFLVQNLPLNDTDIVLFIATTRESNLKLDQLYYVEKTTAINISDKDKFGSSRVNRGRGSLLRARPRSFVVITLALWHRQCFGFAALARLHHF